MTERRDRAPALPQELDRAIYRVYTFDLNRHITARNEIDCANDAEATNAARQTLNGHDIEIWERDRFIAFMKSKASA